MYSEFSQVGKAKWGYPSPSSDLTWAIHIVHTTEIDFAENEPYPILVGRSPLHTAQPRMWSPGQLVSVHEKDGLVFVRSLLTGTQLLSPSLHPTYKIKYKHIRKIKTEYKLN